MLIRSFAAFTIVCGFAFANPLLAQNRPLTDGMKVRFTTANNQKLTGVVKSRTADSITVFTEPSGVPATVAVSSLQKLEISRGKSASHGAKKGAIWGAGIGAAVTGAAMLFGDFCSGSHSDCEDGGQTAVETVGAGALGGAVWGIALGAIIGAEKWEAASIQPMTTFGPRGTKLGFAFRR